MAVLTSPRRTRPRFGPQAGLVAATRGVAFAALMAAGIGLLIDDRGRGVPDRPGGRDPDRGQRGPPRSARAAGLPGHRHRAGPDPVRAAGHAAGHPAAGPADQAADRGLVRRAHRRAVRAPARREAHLHRTAQVAGDGPGHPAGPAVDGGEPARLRAGRGARRDHRDRPDRVHRARVHPAHPAARLPGQHREDADRAGPRDHLGRGAGGPGAAPGLRPAGPLHPGPGRARPSWRCASSS